MTNWKRLLGIGVAAYVAFLVIKIPAALVLPQINQRLPNGTVSLSEPQGSIWAGSIDLTVQSAGRSLQMPGAVKLRWSFRPLDLIYGQLGLDYWVNSIGLDLTGFVADGLSGTELSIAKGTVGPEWVNPLLSVNPALRGQGIRLEKPFELKGVYWEGDWGSKTTRVAQGLLNWEGGPVSVSKPMSMQLTLPEIVGQFSATGKNTLLVDVHMQEGDAPLLTAELLTTGSVKLRVLKRVQSIAGFGQPPDPDAVMIELEHQIM